MTQSNLEQLPPEMQARIADIMTQAQQAGVQVPAPKQPQAPARVPSLMDHTIALRQEVAQLSSQVAAMGQVTEAVGQAVGELYQLFRAQTATTDYSAAYQENQDVESDY